MTSHGSRQVAASLLSAGDAATGAGVDKGARVSPHEERLHAVVNVLLKSRARTILDLGCGPGDLLVLLAREPQFLRILGVDISAEVLHCARENLRCVPPPDRDRVSTLEASFAEDDPRLHGFDAAALVETIEHIDPHRLSLVERAVFHCYRPGIVVVTTPNREYNVLHGMSEAAMRHPDHRFEWTRAKFRAWSRGVARRNQYTVAFADIGDCDVLLGSSTQMATFSSGLPHGGLLGRRPSDCLPGAFK